MISANLGHLASGSFMGSIPRTSQEGLRDFCYCMNTNNFRSSVSDFCGSHLFSCQTHLYILKLLTLVRFFSAKCSHNFSIWKGARISKKSVITVQKIHFLRGFDRKNMLFKISRNLIRKV